MRLTINLSGFTGNLLEALAARVANGNTSLVAETALKLLFSKTFEEQQRFVALERFERTAVKTRAGWMRAFWQRLGELMNQPDAIENLRAPRRFDGFYAVLLMNHIAHEDEENDPFHPHIGPQPVLPDSPTPYQWTFNRSTSPVAAAEAVAEKLREYGVQPKREGVNA